MNKRKVSMASDRPLFSGLAKIVLACSLTLRFQWPLIGRSSLAFVGTGTDACGTTGFNGL